MFAKFEYTAPATVEELLGILAQEKAGTVIYGGGTDVIVDLRSEKLQAERLIDIKTIPELRRITEKKDCICVGCAATLMQIHDDPLVNRYAPTVAQGCGQVGSVQIRNKGTLAGNIQTASPAGDGLNGAMAADAVAVLQSVSGQRRVPLTEYIIGPRKTQRKNDEFLAYIEIPKKEMTFAEFFKVGRRNALAISVVNGAVTLLQRSGVVEDCRIVVGAVAPTPLRMVQAEEILRGEKLTAELAAKIGKLVSASVHPISDIRASAEYRGYMAGTMVKRMLDKAMEG